MLRRSFVTSARFAAAAVVLLTLSCGGGEEEAIPTPAPIEESSEDQFSGVIQPGPVADIVVDEAVVIPSDFPGDIPLYPDAEPAAVLENPASDQHVIALASPDTVGEVTDYYADALGNRDWDIEEEVALGSQSIFSARKGDRVVHVLIATDGMQTVTTIKAVGLD